MEPLKTHGAALPPQELTHPAGGCPPGPRPGDLMPGGHEGANPYAGQSVAVCHPTEKEDSVAMSAPESTMTNKPLQLTRLDIFQILESNARLLGGKLRPVDLHASHRTDLILNAIYPGGIPDITRNSIKTCQTKLNTFICQCEKKYRDCYRNRKTFIRKNYNWLSTVFDPGVLKASVDSADDKISPDKEQQAFSESTQIIADVEEPNIAQVNAPTSRARSITEPATVSLDPTSKQHSMSHRQRRRVRKRLAEELEDQSAAKILKVFLKIVTHGEGNQLGGKFAADLEFIMKECLKTPTVAAKLVNILRSNQESAREQT